MIPFINYFLTYLLLFLIMATLIGFGIFIGITMRKRKNAAEEALTEQEKENKDKEEIK